MILAVEGETGELRGTEAEEMIRTGWEGDERPMREDGRVIREGQSGWNSERIWVNE